LSLLQETMPNPEDNETRKSQFPMDQLSSRVDQLAPVPVLSYIAPTLIAMAALLIAAGAGQPYSAVVAGVGASAVLFVVAYLVWWVPGSFTKSIDRLRRLQLGVLLNQKHVDGIDEKLLRELIRLVDKMGKRKKARNEKWESLGAMRLKGFKGLTRISLAEGVKAAGG
jgi:hypothetical protein